MTGVSLADLRCHACADKRCAARVSAASPQAVLDSLFEERAPTPQAFVHRCVVDLEKPKHRHLEGLGKMSVEVSGGARGHLNAVVPEVRLDVVAPAVPKNSDAFWVSETDSTQIEKVSLF